MLAPIVLLAVAAIVLGAVAGKPAGWFAIGCGVLAILSAAIHWPK